MVAVPSFSTSSFGVGSFRLLKILEGFPTIVSRLPLQPQLYAPWRAGFSESRRIHDSSRQ